MRIIADRQRCIGSGQCVLAAVAVFDQSELDGRVVVLIEHPGPDLAEAAREAADICPSGALEIHKD